ncbi:MAG: copper chaperone PCu(A)C [Pseudomonadota bacterium]
MRILMTVLAMALATPALAHEFMLGDLHIDHPVARATTPMAQASGGFMTIHNRGDQPDRLIAATSDASARTEIHLTEDDNGVMRMREVEGIEIPAGEMVELKPGSFHVMFIGINEPFNEGDTRTAVLTFEKAGEVEVTFNIEQISGGMDHSGHGHGDHSGHGGMDHSEMDHGHDHGSFWSFLPWVD